MRVILQKTLTREYACVSRLAKTEINHFYAKTECSLKDLYEKQLLLGMERQTVKQKESILLAGIDDCYFGKSLDTEPGSQTRISWQET